MAPVSAVRIASSLAGASLPIDADMNWPLAVSRPGGVGGCSRGGVDVVWVGVTLFVERRVGGGFDVLVRKCC
jgi:hypothetical protein